MILSFVTGLRPIRLILKLQALKFNYPKLIVKNYCLAPSVRPNSEQKPTHRNPGRATKLLYQLFTENVSSKTEQGFHEALPNIIEDILELPEYQNVPGVKERLERIILYNTPPHTHLSGIQAVAISDFYEDLRKQGLGPSGTFQDENHLQKTNTLAWCTELITSAFLIKDDIADELNLRHGQPSWHTIQEPNTPGFMAVNDALLLEQAALALVERTFDHHPAQQKLCQVLREGISFVTSSYAMEYIMNEKFKTTGNVSTMNDYCRMRKLQNGYLFWIPPITSVAILNGNTNPLQLKKLGSICMELALYYAIQRDYMDTFQKVKHIGNDETDIQNARITWLLITAFEKASPAQRKQIQENIGKSADSNVTAVLEVLQELDIPKLHTEWQQNFYEETTTKIQNLPETLPRKFLQNQLDNYAHALLPSATGASVLQ